MELKSCFKKNYLICASIGFCVGVICTIILFYLVVACIFQIEDEQEEVDNVEYPIVDDSYFDKYIPSIEDILQEREGLRYSRMVDSVYLTIPDEILISILMNKGTNASHITIVEEYLTKKEDYHKNLDKVKAKEANNH